jgi:hypothetical protein
VPGPTGGSCTNRASMTVDHPPSNHHPRSPRNVSTHWVDFTPRSCTQARIQAAITAGPARGDLVKDHPGYSLPGFNGFINTYKRIHSTGAPVWAKM